MANVQSGFGAVEIFEDFVGWEKPLLNTESVQYIGGLRIIGQGIEATDSGVVSLESDALNGVVQFTTTDESEHTVGITTPKMFDVALMAPIVAECRVRFEALDTQAFYFGFTDVNDNTEILQGTNISGATTTLTLTASDLCGFFISDELTDDEDWHMVYNGGTTTGETVSTSVDADDDAVAGEFQVLRLEIDNNGTARWLIDGVLKQTKAGAVSTTTDLACMAMVEAKTTTVETADLDYFYVKSSRDWTI